MPFVILQGVSFGADLFPSATDLVTISATIMLVLMVVAFGGFVYKSLQGDGIRWPDDVDEREDSDDGVTRSRSDDDWKYY